MTSNSLFTALFALFFKYFFNKVNKIKLSLIFVAYDEEKTEQKTIRLIYRNYFSLRLFFLQIIVYLPCLKTASSLCNFQLILCKIEARKSVDSEVVKAHFSLIEI